MKKIVTLGATILTALTLLGAVQPLAHANQTHVTPKQTQVKLTSIQNKDDADIINIPDANLKKLLNNKIDPTRPATQDITVGEAKACTAGIAYTDATVANQIHDLTGIENFVNLIQLGFASQDFSDVSKIPDLSGMTNLNALNASNCKLNQGGFEKIMNAGTVSNSWVYFDKNHITDMSLIGGRTSWTNYKLGGQTVDEASQQAVDGKVEIPKQNLKNTDGSAPTLTISNGGVEENGNIVWDRLPGSTTTVNYIWVGKNTFSGTVTVPVTWASDEDKAQADVNLLFKDNTRTELNTGLKLQKIEDARKEVDALNNSDKKTELLGQIGDAYGMYFIVDAKGMTAGDALGDKVKADTNMKTLHDFVEAATDFEAEATKAQTTKSANAGTYDYVRSGWSKAVATAVSRVDSYVSGTDLSQAGLGGFSTDVANLKTAASVIQADQQDLTNDKVEVEYNYTAQAPGEPGWYGIVPSAVTLTDANRGTGEVANVELKNATKVSGAYVPYDGGKTVEVFVKSDNGYKLNDDQGDPSVDYKMNYVDNTGTHDVDQDSKEHKIGELKAGSATINSHIDLIGNATKSGRYVDNLFYHFSEK
ncbi:toxin Cry1Ac domain D-VI-related protein [Lactococcus garvieae]|uniref:toxin Cry1Ac domain D-VI-related protein n=1 Tax=Lactococcus garvieae TaxID=1363 RepID=UPI0018D7A631|nr:toxin Cry1Ac domain D-VI-related protein [Lactococcus garvieae]QPS70265.1 hypothetical protein I6G50_05630 [Lactococcus garvieae]